MDSSSRTDKLAASPQLFESDFLNFFSRVPPAVPAIVFVPVFFVVVRRIFKGKVHATASAASIASSSSHTVSEEPGRA